MSRSVPDTFPTSACSVQTASCQLLRDVIRQLNGGESAFALVYCKPYLLLQRPSVCVKGRRSVPKRDLPNNVTTSAITSRVVNDYPDHSCIKLCFVWTINARVACWLLLHTHTQGKQVQVEINPS